MFHDADLITKNSIIDADLCVIGAGAAGIAIARAFSQNSSLKITLLESGKLSPDSFSQTLNILETTSLSLGENSRIRSFGGTTTAWAGRWKPYDAIDFEERSWVPFSGWPISRADLEPYYEKAASMFNGPRLADFQKSGNELLESKNITTSIYRFLRKDRLDFGKNSKKLIEDSINIDTYLGANVSRLETTEHRITSADIKTKSGNTFSVVAKIYVLACGGIENPRLMMASEIANEHDQVGRYFMEHPKGTVGNITLKETTKDLSLYWGKKDSQGLILGAVGLTKEAQQNNQVLNSSLVLDPVYKRTQIIQNFPKASQLIIYKILKVLLGEPQQIYSVAIRNYMEQEPRPENRIILSGSLDPIGNRLPQLTWNISELDKKTMVVLHRTLQKELSENNIGVLKSPLLESKLSSWPISADASHHIGTTRMGNDPLTSVVDKNCRVHSTENLYIAGSSVFPTSGSAGPTATIIALALRLADHLKQTYFSI